MEGDSVVSDRSTAPRHFNPLPPHGGRQEILNSIENAVRISIHSLRMEGDKQGSSCKVREERHFNPLPPHGGRLQLANTIIQVTIFQSTPSAWRETRSFPCREHGFRISIHSLRMEGDAIHNSDVLFRADFNPLPPHGGRRLLPQPIQFHSSISIHSLRMEGDKLTPDL